MKLFINLIVQGKYEIQDSLCISQKQYMATFKPSVLSLSLWKKLLFNKNELESLGSKVAGESNGAYKYNNVMQI